MVSRPALQPASGGPETSFPGLPAVLREGLPHRLSTAAATYAAVFAVMLLVNLLECTLDPRLSFEGPDFYVTMSTCLLAAAAIAVWARRSTASTQTMHFLGLVFQVIGTFGIAFASIDFPLPAADHVGYIGIPWTCPWILAYPLMVPSLPRHAAVAGVVSSLACAAAVKLRLLLLTTGVPDPEPQVWTGLLFMNLICAAWGIVGSVIVNKLGRQVAEARRMGSYELTTLLGKGGMGEVWEGHHRLLARPAAVKLISADSLGSGAQSRLALGRFQREAQATAALQSPHSIGLYDFGIADDGTFYYVMELLKGMDLQSLVKRFGPVKPERAVHWLEHASRSLAEAHHNGLVHRDIKPANLYVSRFGLEWDFLKVLDFGLVKPIAAGASNTELTAEHAITGTPAFMAPESAMGSGDVDGRADIYALGCVAYWLLTGELVFHADSSMGMIMQHVQTEPVAPSTRTELEVSAELDAMVLQCLRKDPADRPQSTRELLELLGGCPEAGRWTQEKAGRWWTRHLPEVSKSGSK